jgi:hypothetical protein
MVGIGAQRKDVTLLTDFRSSPSHAELPRVCGDC